jgi:hypothetical protein
MGSRAVWSAGVMLGACVLAAYTTVGVSLPPTLIYVADSGNNHLVRVNDMAGGGWTAFGTFGSGTNQFNTSTPMAL